ATFLLGVHHLDHGRPLAGALTLQRLGATPAVGERFEPALSLATATGWLQAGAADRAAAILAELKGSRKGRPIRLGGRDVDWFASSNAAAEWLARYAGSLGDSADAASQWLLVRGAPHRNGLAAGGAPLMNLRWEVPVADDPAIEHSLAQQRQNQLEQGFPPIPELHPLVVDDVVLMRTTRNLLAVDLHTGKRQWEVPVDDPMESFMQAASEDPVLRAQFQGVHLAMGERVLQDRTFGTLSSDGRQVYSVEDLMPAASVTSARQLVRGAVRVMPGQVMPGQTQSYNRLAAHEIRTGKLKWHLGGPSDEFALRMAETFFLGPPLPLQGHLFALAEAKDEIRLLAIDAATGGLLWAQPLAVVEQGVMYSPIRRLSGLSPAYADGILVCPTSAGALVAVDLATRSLLWGYRYSQSLAARQRNPFLGLQFGRHTGQPQSATSWTDPNPIVVDGRVLCTPPDSDTLYCLDLADGQPRWTTSREDDLYIACVHRGMVILVGRQRVRALGLADGKPAWEGRTLEFSDGGMPCGHGFYTGSQYLVPLSTAEIALIDLDQGRTVHVARSRRGQIPGNLIGYRGMVLSQSIGGVAAFDQVDVLRGRVADRLAKDPDDAEALALRGELLLDEGKRDEAIGSLSRSYQLASERRTASLLREALLDGFRNDFKAFEGRVAEIEPLLDGPREQVEFLRVMAEGLQHAGRWRDAFGHLLKLAEFDAESRRMEPVDRTLSVRGDRWVRARLATLRAEAAGEEAAEIEQLVAARMQEALAANSMDALRRFLDYFGDDEIAAPAREALV
ncbi:MAG: PQQ-binding-like beta-propeller repeat protein, partial [Patescibacteria group bacterium]|nr:PQQ-binding-like beta-propeller repeat protein [Patescibacteria group bacterium]